MKNTVVIGAGVIGLTTAILLREHGIECDIISANVSPHVTSDVAAAFWCPYMVFPADRVDSWASTSLHYFSTLEAEPAAGVRRRSAINIFPEDEEMPSWTKIVVKEGVQTPPDFDFEGATRIAQFETFVIDMSVYMPFLMNRYRQLGGQIEIAEVASLETLFDRFAVIINCTGLGARQLVNDVSVIPAKGQVVRIKPIDGIDQLWLDDRNEDHFTMVVPRITDIVLGGTYESGNDDISVSDEETAAILQRCTKLVPQLTNAEIIGVKCGLRPSRSSVRLDSELSEQGNLVIHNYGHGGAGVTLSRGCAEDVLRIVTNFLKVAGARA